jgi:DNA polymerase bacteriophage-type
MDICWIDIESRSRCDLIVRGGYNYAADKTTEILIAAFAINNGPIQTWRRWKGEAMPDTLQRALADPKVQIRAHATFERHMLKIDLDRYYDVAAQMRALAIPGGLEPAARFLKPEQWQKDPYGQKLIQLLSMPQKDGKFINDPHLLQRFTDYCASDVDVMRKMSLGTQQMSDETLALYRANEIVNDRGVPIDGELCELAVRYADEAREEARAIVKRISGGVLTKALGMKMKLWVFERIPEHAQDIMVTRKPVSRSVVMPRGDLTEPSEERGKRGPVPITAEMKKGMTLNRDAREALMQLAADNPDGFVDSVVEVIDACDAASPGSVAKFQKMLDQCNSDGRLRGAFILNGAGQTGRFSAWGCQLHNFPRACAKDPEAVLKVMKRRGSLKRFGTTLAVLKSMLRAAIWPRGARIVRTDWNAIEARGLPWLANTPEAERYLDALRDPNRDIYLEQAQAVGLPGNRPAGKVIVLALGYGGSAGALAAVAKGYGVTFSEPLPTIVARWRAANAWAPQFWYAMERAARQAIIAPGSVRVAGRLSFQYVTEPNYAALTMTLPSGRRLFYPFAKLEANEETGGSDLTYVKSAWRPKANKKGTPLNPWPRARLWGGLAVENATQAACADLLRTVVAGGLPTMIGHVHDECISESAMAKASACAREQEKRMLSLPAWADGFPVAVETDISERFRK